MLARRKSYVEVSVSGLPKLNAHPSKDPALVFSRVEDLSEASCVVRKLSQKWTWCFPLRVRRTLQVTRQSSTSRLAARDAIMSWIRSRRQPQKVRSSTIFSPGCSAKEGSEVTPSGAVTFCRRWSACRRQSPSAGISPSALSLVALCAYTSGLTKGLGRSQKLAAKGIAHYKRSVRIQDSLAGRAFAA